MDTTIPRPFRVQLSGTDVRASIRVPARSGWVQNRRMVWVSGSFADAVFRFYQKPGAAAGSIDEFLKDDSTDEVKFPDTTKFGHVVAPVPHGTDFNADGVGETSPTPDDIEVHMLSTVSAVYWVEISWTRLKN